MRRLVLMSVALAAALALAGQVPDGQAQPAQPATTSGGQTGSPAGTSADSGKAIGGQSGEAATAALTPPQVDPAQLQRMAGSDAVTIDGKRVGEFAKVVSKGGGHGAVIETGGFLGIGEVRHVVPLDRIRIKDQQIVVDMSEAELDKLPVLESGGWNNFKN